MDLEKKRSVRSRNENRNNDSGSSNSSGSSAKDLVLTDFLLHILYADATTVDACSHTYCKFHNNKLSKGNQCRYTGGLPYQIVKKMVALKVWRKYRMMLNCRQRLDQTMACDVLMYLQMDAGWHLVIAKINTRIHDLRDMSEFSNIKSHDAEVLGISFLSQTTTKRTRCQLYW